MSETENLLLYKQLAAEKLRADQAELQHRAMARTAMITCDQLLEANEKIHSLEDQIKELQLDLKCHKEFSDLLYFACDEVPMEFGSIVAEWTPSQWINQLHKLKKEHHV